MTSPDLEQRHADLVARLAKPGEKIIADLTPKSAHVIHMAIGVAGEAGELLDATKKYAIYVKPIDLENVIEELGDLEFYMRGLRDKLGISRAETLENNLAKLEKRYGTGTYSDQQAQARADKKLDFSDSVLAHADLPNPDAQPIPGTQAPAEKVVDLPDGTQPENGSHDAPGPTDVIRSRKPFGSARV